MNPMTNVKNVLKLSERELGKGGHSWHDQYRHSAWVFIGGLPYNLTEGDIICIFSQYGEVVHINLVRDKATGKQKGFCFLCYEDQRSTDLAVDNLNGTKVLTRTLRVDHCENYKTPQESKKNPVDEDTARLRLEGCAPQIQVPVKNEHLIKTEKTIDLTNEDIELPPRLPIRRPQTPDKSHKKSKKAKKKKKRRRKSSSSETD